MSSCAAAGRRVRRLLPVLVVALALVVAGCRGSSGQYPQSTLHPRGDFAALADHVFMTTVYWAVVVFVLVEGALLYVIFRYRGRPDDPEPKQIHGNTVLEIIWTAIPAIILALIAVPTVRAIFETYRMPRGKDVLQVEVVGHQWWWEFRYPQYGLTTANELHIPAGRTVALRLHSVDVIHSFWIPPLAGKRDVFPVDPQTGTGRYTDLWFRGDSVGYYSGQCAEFCGEQHGRMGFDVAVTSQADFDAYLRDLQATGQPAPTRDTVAAAPVRTAQAALTVTTLAGGAQAGADTGSAALLALGAKLFQTRGCVACHSLDATKNPAYLIGPNLANIGSRRFIGAGLLPNTEDNLARWIHNPQLLKVGVKMPDMGVPLDSARVIAAYLRTHR